jgi:hypothetical protein
MDREQTDKLWNWCGFEYHWYPITFGGVSKQCGWYLNGKFRCANKPHYNLDNLNRYAIPKLNSKNMAVTLIIFYGCRALIHVLENGYIYSWDAPTPTEALYNAIMKVIDNEAKHEIPEK